VVKSKYTLFDIKSEIDLILADSRSILEFNKDELGIIINVWIDALRKKRMLVDINSDNVLVVGDIHGDLEQLQRALHLYDIGEVSKVVFNGDLIDRGPEMVECISLVMIYQLLYPDDIIFLRGNHELTSINSVYGFRGYTSMIFGTEIYGLFSSAFQQLPLCAKIQDHTFITHGGVPSQQIYFHLMRIEPKPKEPEIGPYSELLWNDPDEAIKNFGKSPRGPNCFRFGKVAFDNFMEFHELDFFIRAHQAFSKGYKWFFDNKLLSVFSSRAGPYHNVNPHFAQVKGNDITLISADDIEI